MDTIPGRRVVGVILLALAFLAGLLAFSILVGSCQPGRVEPTAPSTPVAPPAPSAPAPSAPPTPPATPTPSTSSGSTTPIATSGASRRPQPASSDAPIVAGTIPPIVPIPSGPNP